jgi:hypothetical protein
MDRSTSTVSSLSFSIAIQRVSIYVARIEARNLRVGDKVDIDMTKSKKVHTLSEFGLSRFMSFYLLVEVFLRF